MLQPNHNFPACGETLLPQAGRAGPGEVMEWVPQQCCYWVMKAEREKRCEVGISVLLQGHSPACPQPVTPASPGFPLHCQSQPQSLGRGSQPGRHRLCISPYLWCVQPPCPTPQHLFLLLFAQGEAVLVTYSNSLLRLWNTHSGSDLGVVMHSLSLWEMTLYLISFPQRMCDSSCVTSSESTEHFAVSITNRAFGFHRTEV